MKTPTDEQLNLAMCEWMGWKKDDLGFWRTPKGYYAQNQTWLYGNVIPDYLSDDSPRRLLNEAEAKLTPAQSREYSGMLLTLLGFNCEIPFFTECGSATVEFEQMCCALRSSTARQRVIAILQTVKPELFK